VQVDAIQERAGYFVEVFLYGAGVTITFFIGVIIVAAGAYSRYLVPD